MIEVINKVLITINKVTRKILQFCRDNISDGVNAPSRNNEDNFVDIPDVIIRITEILSE